MALREYVANCAVSPHQYVWISTLNDHSFYLSMKKDDGVLALMNGNTWKSSDSRMVRGNFYLPSDVGEYGIIVTLFTEEIELRNNCRKILTILGVEAMCWCSFARPLPERSAGCAHSRKGIHGHHAQNRRRRPRAVASNVSSGRAG